MWHRLRQYNKTALMALTGYFGDNPLCFVGYGAALLRVVVLLSIWRTVFAGRGVVGGMSLEAVLTYTVIAEAFGGLLSFTTTFAGELWNSAITMRFLRPMPVFPQYIAEALANWGVTFLLFGVPLLCLSPLFGVNPLPHSPMCGMLFLASLALGLTVASAIELIFGSIIVYFGSGDYAMNNLRLAMTTLLSGALLPLNLFPFGIGRLFGWLPFASMASAPLRIYTGAGDPLPLLLTQAAWALVLWPLAVRIWQVQREKLVTFGG